MIKLNVRWARAERSRRWRAAPKASQRKQLGRATATKSAARVAACTAGLAAEAELKKAAALALASHDLGLSHWNAAAPAKPTGRAPVKPTRGAAAPGPMRRAPAQRCSAPAKPMRRAPAQRCSAPAKPTRRARVKPTLGAASGDGELAGVTGELTGVGGAGGELIGVAGAVAIW